MKIKEIIEKAIWEDFLLKCEGKTFLSSWNWGEFNKMMGNKIWRLGIFENNTLVSAALIIKIQAKRGTFLFVPHGPNIISNSQSLISKKEILSTLLEKLKDTAKEEKASFIRISPIWPARRLGLRSRSYFGEGGSLGEGGERNNENMRIFKNLGFRNAPIHMHPELTWELDITPSEEEILMKMRKTTRYLIRQAEKNKDIEIIQSPASAEASAYAKASADRSAGKQNLKDIEKFNNLYQETVDRHHFVPFSLNYLENEFLAFNKDNQISIFLGKYKKEIVSSGIFIFWQNIGFYHHGASSLKYPKIPVSYLLQWKAIQEAKKRGCKAYNFWGIAPITLDSPRTKAKLGAGQGLQSSKHPWAGLTLFKMGFGGYKKEYLKTQDLPLSFKYWLTYIFEKLRKQKRGL